MRRRPARATTHLSDDRTSGGEATRESRLRRIADTVRNNEKARASDMLMSPGLMPDTDAGHAKLRSKYPSRDMDLPRRPPPECFRTL